MRGAMRGAGRGTAVTADDQDAAGKGAAWSFDAAQVPVQERAAAWGAVMRRLHRPFADPVRPDGAGRVLAATSPLGFDFALVTGGAQSIGGRTPSAEPGLWLGLLIAGEATLAADGLATRLERGHLIHGATGVDARLDFPGPFRQLFVRIPRVALGRRLLAPIDARVAVREPASLAESALTALLRTVAAALAEGRADDLGSIDGAFVELLVPALARWGGAAGRGGAAAARARQLDRICRIIEMQLGDPDMTVRSVARGEGVSVRYLQQLFAAAGLTASGHIRARRLERARTELESPLHARLSISEIAYRWGFSQSAHFSRAYRARYGETPRDSRVRALRGDAAGAAPA